MSLDIFEKTIWVTVSGHGDMDTNCAIVGGIVATYTGAEVIPAEWFGMCEDDRGKSKSR
jgi:ADP-ribosylglycohydrolase